MSNEQKPWVPDKRWVSRSFAAAAGSYDEVAVLQREVADRLLERLELVRLSPERILDAGSGTGYASAALRRRYPGARLYALDIAQPMAAASRDRGSWRRRIHGVCGDAEQLPLASASIDLVVSSLALQWCRDLDAALTEFFRVLRPGGLLIFTSFGPDTLRELRTAWAAVDEYSHVNAFVDMHDVGDALVRAGFADPVLDVEPFTLTYEAVPDLMRDLKALGAHNVTVGRNRGLTGRGRLQAMMRAYEDFRDAQGRLPASYEVVHAHAWMPERKPQRLREDGTVMVPIGRIPRRGG
ncbi:malonyl-ACP O-methyltransferase BioC [Alkalilimnicola sp. S0819]|uniref:malonyl-ACP O-methyltransferase BioC n=1 Tax=Alkalilimnicola sp. S0819 TaxID=2613922 RepID=UPI00126179E7|nr:malonyl-ACP O-methyltransferase BioC [Alkalilimnicola sp. S0819]KAB7624431.1 malonyl-ACP O-methyltransferase BioC [Alkalilimnicola sp. S0819]MPQ16264.1 malonyl-ACP O-methyltransferase BioC [Alkalilimnicola sp. S0819]